MTFQKPNKSSRTAIIVDHNDPRFSDRLVWANNVDAVLSGSTQFGILSASFWNIIVKPLCSNFRITTAKILEPPRDETNKMTVHPAKVQISLSILPVWSESSLCTQWVATYWGWVPVHCLYRKLVLEDWYLYQIEHVHIEKNIDRCKWSNIVYFNRKSTRKFRNCDNSGLIIPTKMLNSLSISLFWSRELQ